MAIYRGAGGPGDAIADSANTAQLAQTYASNAAASAAAAAASATAAAASESSVSDDATAAAASAAAAASSASAAASSASAAASSASTSSSSAVSSSDSASAALASKVAAEAAQVAAETAQTAAETAQAAAETAQGAAETAQTGAETAETGAVAAQTAAEAARDATLAAYDSFDDRYLGVKISDPTLDNDGNALVAGSLYFNSVDEKMRLYTGSAWVDAYVTGADLLVASNNLSDLTNTATARTNLGLGTAATTAATDYATAAQGALADSAVQPGDLATVATTGAYSDLTGTPTNVSSFTNDAGYLTDITGESIKDLSDVYTSMSPTDGQLLTWDNTNSRWDAADAPVSLPDQTGHAGEFLTTDGSTASWAEIATGNTTATGLWENSNTISANYTITTNYNAMSAGPVTVASGVTVTVPTGSRWVVI